MANFTICTVITMHIVNMGQMKLIVSYIYLQCDTVFSYAHTCVDYLLWFPTHVFCSHRKKTRKCDSNISAIWSLLSFLSFLRERERERERHGFVGLVVPLIYAFVGQLLYVPRPGTELTTLAHRDDAATWPGPPLFSFGMCWAAKLQWSLWL